MLKIVYSLLAVVAPFCSVVRADSASTHEDGVVLELNGVPQLTFGVFLVDASNKDSWQAIKRDPEIKGGSALEFVHPDGTRHSLAISTSMGENTVAIKNVFADSSVGKGFQLFYRTVFSPQEIAGADFEFGAPDSGSQPATYVAGSTADAILSGPVGHGPITPAREVTIRFPDGHRAVLAFSRDAQVSIYKRESEKGTLLELTIMAPVTEAEFTMSASSKM